MKPLSLALSLIVVAFVAGCPRGYEAAIDINPVPIVRFFDVPSGQEVSYEEAEARLTRVVTAVLKDPDEANLVILVALIGYTDTGSPLGRLAVAARSDAGLRVSRGGEATKYQHALLFGFANVSSAVELSQCPAGTSFVRERQTMGHLIGFFLTAGLWGPTTVEVDCGAPK